MKDTDHTSQTEIKIWPQADCRFAYTLNNAQPVRCSYIADQPLFYADCDYTGEDDDILDDPLFQQLEKDIAVLSQRTAAYEKLAQDFYEPQEATAQRCVVDAQFLSSTDTTSLSWADLEDVLGKSRFAAQLLSTAHMHGIDIVLSNHVADAFYDRDAKIIFVRPTQNLSDAFLLTVRELRRAFHHKNGAGLHPLNLHPDVAILVNRAQTADLSVSQIRAAWDLQLTGDKSVWVRLENSPLHDMARAFGREACVDFRSLNSGSAARAAFECWFLSERCRKADRLLIQQMLADYQGYVFADNAEGSKAIAADILRQLGEQNFGANYLAASVTQMLHDPVFTDVRDRSNANFLWFIKFERSFRDAEDSLDSSTTSKTPATILAFPRAPVKKPLRKAKNDAADIVLFIPPASSS